MSSTRATNPGKHIQHRAAIIGLWIIFIALAVAPGQSVIAGGEKHAGVKMECFATRIAPESIAVIDKKGQEHTIVTERDYTGLITPGAALTIWYTNHGGTFHLEDIDLPRESLFLPGEDIRTTHQRIIILSTSEDVENSQGIIDAIGGYLRDNTGWSLAPANQGAEIEKKLRASDPSLDSITPQFGDAQKQRLMETQGNMAAKVATEAHVDAVLEIKVEKVRAHVKKTVAKWDDMTEVVASTKTRALATVTGLGGSGWVYAATVDMNLWNRNGKLLWNKRRGFAALGHQTGVGVQYRSRPLTEVYADHAAMQQWLATTLGRLAPPTQSVTPVPVYHVN